MKCKYCKTKISFWTWIMNALPNESGRVCDYCYARIENKKEGNAIQDKQRKDSDKYWENKKQEDDLK